MIIKSIHLKNFRQYRDFRIEFDINDKNKNVTVIRAKNSTGKTTLAQAIIWCLYGEEEINLDFNQKILNKYEMKKAIKNEAKEVSYSVELEIIENNNISSLKRTQYLYIPALRKKSELLEYVYRDRGEKIVEVANEKEIEKRKTINKKINSLLSKNIANNFIFDGERIEKIADNSKKSSRDEISSAITSISLLPTLKNSLNNLEQLSKRLRKEEAKAIDDDEVEDIEKKLNSNEKEKENFQTELKEAESNKLEKDQQFNEIEVQLSNYKDIAFYQKQRKTLDTSSTRIKEELEKIKKDIFAKFSQYKFRKYIYMLSKKYDSLNLMEVDSTSMIPHVTTESIDYLLNRGECICGREIDYSSKENLITQKKYQPPESPESMIQEYNLRIQKEIGKFDELVEDIKSLKAGYESKLSELNQLEEKIKDINNMMDKSNEKVIRDLNSKRTEIMEEKERLGSNIVFIKSQLKENEEENLQLQQEYNRIKKEKLNSDKLRIKGQILAASYQRLEDISNTRTSKLRAEIETVANKHFSEIISKEKRICISDDFYHKVIDQDGEETATSSGELIAVSISIIIAIIETHKSRIMKHKDDLESEIINKRDFFLVMDGPFAVLDQDFSKEISSKLAASVEQMILLTNDNQYNESVQGSLIPKLNKEYILNPPPGEGENLYTSYLEVEM